MRRIAILIVFVLVSSGRLFAITIGTMSGEVRTKGEQRIDIDRTINALVKLNVTTYYYLIWQNPHDWDDLPAFADAAARHNIQVWVYIIPWSETPLKKQAGWGYSEPFRTDYVAWSSEIAKLSLAHPNIAGYVIDDFYDNTDEGHFTPSYVRKMVGAGQRINPKIKFYPLMYFQTPWQEFINRFGNTVDGVVLCYPKSEAGIRNAATYLGDRRHGPSAIVQLGRHKGAERGDGAYVVADVNIEDPSQAEVSFYYDATDDIEGDTSLEYARVRIEGRTVWESKTEGKMRDGIINIDLTRAIRRPGKIRVEFDVLTARTGVPDQLPVIVRFDDVRVYGASRGSTPFAYDLDLRGKPLGKFDLTLMPGSPGGGRLKLPIVLMPTGEGEQFEKRYDMRGTPQEVAKKVRLSLEMANLNIVDGVVPYRTPLLPNDPFFQAIQAEYQAFQSRAGQ